MQPRPSPSCPAGAGPLTRLLVRCAAVADVNGDGLPDLLVLNTSTPNLGNCQLSPNLVCDANTRIRVLLANGGAGFTEGPLVPTGCNPARLVTGDFDDDGVLDLVTMNLGYVGPNGPCIRPSLSRLPLRTSGTWD